MGATQRGRKTCLEVGGIHKHVGSSGKEGGEQSNGRRTGGLHLTWSRQGQVTSLALTRLFHGNRPLCIPLNSVCNPLIPLFGAHVLGSLAHPV